MSLLRLLQGLGEISHTKGAYQVFLAESKNWMNLSLLLLGFVIAARWFTLVSAENITSLVQTSGKMVLGLHRRQIAKNITSMDADTGPVLFIAVPTLPRTRSWCVVNIC